MYVFLPASKSTYLHIKQMHVIITLRPCECTQLKVLKRLYSNQQNKPPGENALMLTCKTFVRSTLSQSESTQLKALSRLYSSHQNKRSLNNFPVP